MVTDPAVTFGRRISQLAAVHPSQAALVFAPTTGSELHVSWETLDRSANQVGRLLARAGAGPGSMVVVALPNSPEHLFTTIGAWRLGACVVPLRADGPSWERTRLLAVADPDVVVGDWPETTTARITLDQLRASGDLVHEPMEDQLADPFLAIASSGSTGLPKLIVSCEPGTYDADAPVYQTATEMGADGAQVQLVPTALYHTNGFRIAHAALQRDETLVLMERFDPALAVDLIERHRVTTVTMAPPMLLRIARLPDIAERDLSSLRSVLQGAAPCPPWLVRWWIERVGAERFFIAYGASERVGVTMIRGDEWLRRPGSVGRGLRTDIRILADDMRELPTGEIGEVFLRQHYASGPTFRYVGAPPARSTDDGFTSVGDLGKLDDDGYLYVIDRRSDMIVTGGVNVFPAEVEAALLEHPGVADVAVVGVTDPEWGRRVHAVIEPTDPTARPGVEMLRAHCRARLARSKVPKTFSFVVSLPRSEAGKLNRVALGEAVEAARS